MWRGCLSDTNPWPSQCSLCFEVPLTGSCLSEQVPVLFLVLNKLMHLCISCLASADARPFSMLYVLYTADLEIPKPSPTFPARYESDVRYNVSPLNIKCGVLESPILVWLGPTLLLYLLHLKYLLLLTNALLAISKTPRPTFATFSSHTK